MQDFTLDAVSYIQEPQRSKHRAAAFRMSARDLARFDQLYLDRGKANGKEVLTASWIDQIAHEYSETGRVGLRWGHGYLWWLPGPNSGLPAGTFWAWGLGNQALFVIPAWDTVIVHQADTTEFRKRFVPRISAGQQDGEAVLEELILSCRKRSNINSEYCIEHRFITRREFTQLVALIAAARRSS